MKKLFPTKEEYDGINYQIDMLGNQSRRSLTLTNLDTDNIEYRLDFQLNPIEKSLAVLACDSKTYDDDANLRALLYTKVIEIANSLNTRGRNAIDYILLPMLDINAQNIQNYIRFLNQTYVNLSTFNTDPLSSFENEGLCAYVNVSNRLSDAEIRNSIRNHDCPCQM